MITAGIDAGSRTTKIVLWDDSQGVVLAKDYRDQGVEQARVARELYEHALQSQSLTTSQVQAVVATGYGRDLIEFAATTITEITCHARGVAHLEPDTRTIIEIGGQDSKLIRMEPGGLVRDFAMNDRCAAGTGRFLEMVATRLEVPLDKLSDLARQSREPASISSMCVVFADTEIIGLLASGKPPADIVAGVQHSVASRVAGMAGRRVEEPIRFTGGVALIPGMVQALAKALQHPVEVVSDPLYTGALGAALLAANRQRARLKT